VKEPESLRRYIEDVAIDYLALGLDPEKATLFRQSDIPEVHELTWILSTITPMGLLERCHSYKDKISQGISPSHGLFAYPVLMAADILIYKSDIVPVGKDQKQHIEVTRDIAIKFNGMYGDVFVVPKEHIVESTAVVPGIDGRKMSKSYDNTIEIFEDPDELKKKIMRIVTDSKPVKEPKDPDKCPLFALYRLVASKKDLEYVEGLYRNGGLSYKDMKGWLIDSIGHYFFPHKKKREELANDMGYVRGVLKKGAEKARAAAARTLKEVREKIGID
jgi:tryptophanyl-tRNA synthetase